MSRANLIAILLLVSLIVAACSVTADPGEVVFQDDFSRPVSGWDRYYDPTYSSDYYEGGYLMHVLKLKTDAWASLRLDLADGRIEVDSSKIGGSEDTVLDVFCR